MDINALFCFFIFTITVLISGIVGALIALISEEKNWSCIKVIIALACYLLCVYGILTYVLNMFSKALC